MIYEYIIDADVDYEDWMQTSIFSTELLSEEEFKEIIKNAQESNPHKEFTYDWNQIAKAIVEMDDRFFFPEKGRYAIIKYDDNNKLKGVY